MNGSYVNPPSSPMSCNPLHSSMDHGDNSTTQVVQVVVSRDEKGYGMKVSGDNPVYVQSVKEGGAAEKAGLHAGDKIIRVNDVSVISSRHTEVVELIRASSEVVLTIQQRSSYQRELDNMQLRPASGARITGPQPVDNAKQHQLQMEKNQHYRLMIEKEQRYLDLLRSHIASSPDEKKYAELVKTEKNLQTLKAMLEKSQNEIPSSAAIQTIVGSNLQFSMISPSEASRRLIMAERTSDLSALDDWENPVTPPGTPPPPYPSASFLEMADEYPALQTESGRNREDSPSHQKNQQSIISMEDDEISDEELDNEANHGYFKSISRLWEHLPHLAVFMNYLLLNSNPNCILFYLLTDLYKEGNTKDMRKWAFEIHSCFLVPGAPLILSNVDENIAYEIDEILSREYDKEEILRKVFWKARSRAKEILSFQLTEFQQKRIAGLGTMFGPTDQALQEIYMDKSKETKLYESLFFDKLPAYLEELDSENYNSTRFYLAAALVTVLIRVFGMKLPSFNADRSQTFVSKDKSFKTKFIGRYSRKLSFHGHQFIAQQYYTVIICNQCHHIIYGIGPQGYQCSVCLINLHKHCVKIYEDSCPGPINKKDRGLGKFIRMRHESNEPRRKQSRLLVPERDRKAMEGSSHDDVLENTNKQISKLAPDCEIHDQSGETEPLLQQDSDTMNEENSNFMESVTDFGTAVHKSTTSNIGRSESVKETTEKRKQRRNISDPSPSTTSAELDLDQASFSNTESSSTSNSSMSFNSRLSESPSNSVEIVKSDKANKKRNCDWESDTEGESGKWELLFLEEQLRQLQPHEKIRQDVINELFNTEHSHVRNLRVLYEIFYKSLVDSQTLRADELALIFPNIKEILHLHTQFNKEMKKCRKQDPLSKNLGSMLVNWFGGPVGDNLRKSAAVFCERQQLALEFIKERRKRDSKFDMVLTECEKRPQCKRLPLQGILPTEMQRLSKYPLLMERLIQSTVGNDDNREDLAQLEQAYSLSKEIINYVNEAAKIALNCARLENLQRHLDTSHFERSDHPIAQDFKNIDLTRYRLILEGSMQLRRPNKGAVQVHVLLLEEAVVILQKEGERFVLKFFQSGSSSQPPLSPIIKISTLLVRNNAVCKNALFLVNTSTNNSQMYDLLAEDDSKRDMWFKHFFDATEAYNRKEGTTKKSLPEYDDTEILQELRIDDNIVSSASTIVDNSEGHKEDIQAASVLNEIYEEPNTTAEDGNSLDKIRVNEWPLIEPSQVYIELPPVHKAEMTLTPLEQIRRKNEEVHKALTEKQNLVADLLNIPRQDFTVIAELTNEVRRGDCSRELSDEVLAAIYQVDLLQFTINAALNISDSAVIASTGGKHMVCGNRDASYANDVPSVSVNQISDIVSSLSLHLTALLSGTKQIEEERARLRKELFRVREQLHESELLHSNTITANQAETPTDIKENEENHGS